MTYELGFVQDALKEWRKLDATLREQFKKKLGERLSSSRVPAARLHGEPERYKIKLRSAGYRLVYEVRDNPAMLVVIAVGRRDRNEVYVAASRR